MRRWFLIIATFTALVVVFILYACVPRPALATIAMHSTFKTLIIDAGHGGEDGGAVSVAGRKESIVNLAISRRARDLSVLLGLPCAMTRDADVSLHTDTGSIAQRKMSDIKNRTAFIDAMPDALLVSIHQNHFPQGKYHGAQVFYAGTDGSEALARIMQQLLRDTLDSTNHRAIKRSQGVYLMEHVRCPAVLVECGFLSNAAEEEKLHDPNYQKKIATAILSAVIQYKCEAMGIEQT